MCLVLALAGWGSCARPVEMGSCTALGMTLGGWVTWTMLVGLGVSAARLHSGNKPKLSPVKPMQSNQFNSSV